MGGKAVRVTGSTDSSAGPLFLNVSSAGADASVSDVPVEGAGGFACVAGAFFGFGLNAGLKFMDPLTVNNINGELDTSASLI